MPGVHAPASFAGKTTTLTTLQKDPVTIYGAGGKLHIGDAFGADQSGEAITASNGVIIPIDAVPVPEFSQSDDMTAVPAPHEGLAPTTNNNVLAPPSGQMDL